MTWDETAKHLPLYSLVAGSRWSRSFFFRCGPVHRSSLIGSYTKGLGSAATALRQVTMNHFGCSSMPNSLVVHRHVHHQPLPNKDASALPVGHVLVRDRHQLRPPGWLPTRHVYGYQQVLAKQSQRFLVPLDALRPPHHTNSFRGQIASFMVDKRLTKFLLMVWIDRFEMVGGRITPSKPRKACQLLLIVLNSFVSMLLNPALRSRA